MRKVPFELKYERIIAGRCINCGHKFEPEWNDSHIKRKAGKSRPASFFCKRYYGAFSADEEQAQIRLQNWRP